MWHDALMHRLSVIEDGKECVLKAAVYRVRWDFQPDWQGN
jgi:hypothetical protein